MHTIDMLHRSSSYVFNTYNHSTCNRLSSFKTDFLQNAKTCSIRSVSPGSPSIHLHRSPSRTTLCRRRLVHRRTQAESHVGAAAGGENWSVSFYRCYLVNYKDLIQTYKNNYQTCGLVTLFGSFWQDAQMPMACFANQFYALPLSVPT